MYQPMKPPVINIGDKELKTRVDLIIHKYALRKEISRLRHKWDLPENGFTDRNKAEFETEPDWRWLDREADEGNELYEYACYRSWVKKHARLIPKEYAEMFGLLLKIAGGLSPAWFHFMENLVFFNDTSRLPLKPEGRLIKPENEQGAGSYTVFWGSSKPYIDVRLYEKLSKKEWIGMYNDIKLHMDILPNPKNWNSALIKLHSQVADLRREGKNFAQIATILPSSGEIENIRQIAKRAKQHGM